MRDFLALIIIIMLVIMVIKADGLSVKVDGVVHTVKIYWR